MMRNIYKSLAVLFFVSAGMSGLIAQNQPIKGLPDTSEYPYYVNMMQDPEADFRATQRAFEKYWEGRTDFTSTNRGCMRTVSFLHRIM